MGCVVVSHPANSDLQWTEQGSSVWHCVAGASGCLLHGLHILHLLHWVLPAAGSYMYVLPAHYSQGKSPQLHTLNYTTKIQQDLVTLQNVQRFGGPLQLV